MKRYVADKTCMNLIRLCVFALTATVIILARLYLSFLPVLMWSVTLAFLVIGCFIALIYLPVYFRHACYYLNKSEIIKHSGFLLLHKQTMRLDAIQCKTLITTPFSRLTGLNFLVLNAFGGSMLLLFLSSKDAEDLHRHLSA